MSTKPSFDDFVDIFLFTVIFSSFINFPFYLT